ncbi:hypothetical protein BGZ60DRAFT_370004 [Tricladium varicosporioides]|nr:hypothetical protein BGZ60DRAFT_370004 [Hymenoscyphus varicosporioides]
MDAAPKRKLIKGPLRPPKPQPNAMSQTQKRASKDEISIRKRDDKGILVKEFTSQMTPQPFLDPSILQLRIQAQKQWESDREKKAQTEAQASSS